MLLGSRRTDRRPLDTSFVGRIERTEARALGLRIVGLGWLVYHHLS